jgi:hypothetical protein
MEVAVILAVEEDNISGERPDVLEWACLGAPELGAVNAGAEVTGMAAIGAGVTGTAAIGTGVTGTAAIGVDVTGTGVIGTAIGIITATIM